MKLFLALTKVFLFWVSCLFSPLCCDCSISLFSAGTDSCDVPGAFGRLPVHFVSPVAMILNTEQMFISTEMALIPFQLFSWAAIVCEYFFLGANCAVRAQQTGCWGGEQGWEASGRAAQSKLMALASQEGWLRLWGQGLKMCVHLHSCVCVHVCMCVHTCLCGSVLVLKAWQGWEKALSFSQLVLPSTSFSSFSPPSCLHQIITAWLQTWTSLAGGWAEETIFLRQQKPGTKKYWRCGRKGKEFPSFSTVIPRENYQEEILLLFEFFLPSPLPFPFIPFFFWWYILKITSFFSSFLSLF